MQTLKVSAFGLNKDREIFAVHVRFLHSLYLQDPLLIQYLSLLDHASSDTPYKAPAPKIQHIGDMFCMSSLITPVGQYTSRQVIEETGLLGVMLQEGGLLKRVVLMTSPLIHVTQVM
ncbi:hypothetical protein AMECASPLE_001492 [Ameca splendens]|uniref:Uncharacterized protein n=1 Tax=Ameca splendens TaxID=208324 RepID=A0ABV0X9Y2_9TELE